MAVFVAAITGAIAGASVAGYIIENGQLVVEEESATTAAVEKVSPSVVSIIISKDISGDFNQTGPNIFPFDNFFDFGFPFDFRFRSTEENNQAPRKQEIGGGTGFIISEDGLILTNKHVVLDLEADYTVLTNDGREFEATVLARDQINDIAIVKIEASGLSVVELGNSDNLKLGQTVIAIGNALGEFRNTVTKGIISGIDRRVLAGNGQQSEVIEEAIQTDAAINPGNSGGPLINLSGQVVGINTAVSQAGQLIGFAIPVNLAKNAIDSVREFGRIVRPYIGVRYVMVNEGIAEENNLNVDHGALIVQGDEDQLAIVVNSPAEKAGLQSGDVILEVNGRRIDLENSLAHEIVKYRPGDQAELKISRDGQEQIVKIILGEFEE